MARCEWVIACERVVIEDEAKDVSLIAILETVMTPKPPESVVRAAAAQGPIVLPLRFYVAHQWVRSNSKIGERTLTRTRLIGPDGKQFGSQEATVDLTGSKRARIISQALGRPVSREGMYRCVVEQKVRLAWRKAGETEFGFAYQPGKRH